ncbi:hypothetical protein LMG27177_02295 [Paraburkholderia fynbosensis]|uniref:Uncharacterized protein n=1 Tax=Paraburkholderia fynbosensis TaxID=1200993 RepID=A0A6J5FUV5_9BURK|nr:hypothetical protein LMG27177_02295 [Paraburkholderia fynbosensis]
MRAAFDYAAAYQPALTRYGRSQILERATALLCERTEDASHLSSLESGLSKHGSRYDIGRLADVRVASGMEHRSGSARVCVRTGRVRSRASSTNCAGAVNVWEVPGCRIELTPCVGITLAGPGHKEGAQKSFTNLKNFLLPWE